MKIPDLFNLIKRLIEIIPKRDIEKLIFKILLGIWLLVIVVVVILRVTLEAHNDIEKKIIEAATSVKFPAEAKTDMKKYETLLNLAKYPEGIEKYTRGIKRDPFSEYKEITITPTAAIKHDFVLRSIDRMPLPMVYKGYIELPDRIIGQMNWRDATRFVEPGLTLNGYRISSVSKEKVEAIDEKGEKIEFELNKPIFGDELQAILYDNVSKETFNVGLSSEIADYKVVDIAPNYVILLSEDEEIKLER